MADKQPADKTTQTTPSTSEAGPSKGVVDGSKKKLPQLGALEDDDEFEVGL